MSSFYQFNFDQDYLFRFILSNQNQNFTKVRLNHCPFLFETREVLFS